MEDVLQFIRNNTQLKAGDYVVIGLSGGPDSMALLNHLLQFKNIVNIEIVAAHVHHNLRKESDEEALIVKKYCEDNDVIFEMTKLEYNQKFTESIGHEKRYDFFSKIINKYHAKYLFTAHHGDDLIETILMRLVRGSTLKGYAGFKKIVKRKNYNILRPLIEYSKEEIIKYVNDNNIPYVIDNSNTNIEYTRNRYRKYILPFLKSENSNVHLKFLQFSSTLNECSSYIEEQVDKVYEKIVSNSIINLDLLKKEHQIIIKGIINRWLHKEYQDNIKLINKKHTDNIYNLIFDSKPNIAINLPNYKVIKAYNRLYIEECIKNINYEYILEDKVVLPNNHYIVKVLESNLTNNYVTHLNSQDICLPLIVRNYHMGDKMTIKNMKGHKSISDIFINEKVNLQERDSYPIVTDSKGEIIWLPGIKKSSFDNKNTGKYDIILEYH